MESLLNYPPGLSVTRPLDAKKIKTEIEAMKAKCRMETSRINQHNEDYQGGLEEKLWVDLEDQEKVQKLKQESTLRQILNFQTRL